MRIQIAGVSWVLAALLSIGPSAAADGTANVKQTATLRQSVRVDGPRITLGDLFDNAGAHAGDDIAAAPAPGDSLVLDAGWLVANAHAHGLSWLPPSQFVTLKVERAAIEITTPEIETALANAIGLTTPERRLVLDNRVRLYAPTGADKPEIEISHLEYDKDTNRVKAEAKIAGDDPGLRRITVYGRVQSMIELPVLARTVMPGERITAQDITLSWMRTELTPAGAIANTQELIGKTPRRPLRAGQPFRPLDVETPIVVHRNDFVLIVLERPGLYLTAQGKALEDGGQGNVIKVMNVQSNRSLDAVVDGDGQVSVRLSGPQQASF
jgi:flagella basal body P-ring formation protein FlgA